MLNLVVVVIRVCLVFLLFVLNAMCRVIGASLIIAGLYLVVLGKDEESKYNTEKAMMTVSENTWAAKSSVVQPLLPTINES